MRKAYCRLLILPVLALMISSALHGDAVRIDFSALAYIAAPLPLGVTNAWIFPVMVNSNGSIRIHAKTEGNPADVRAFFPSFPETWILTNRTGEWKSGLGNAFRNESIYTASFITVYSNGQVITNRNRAWYAVDNTPPFILSSRPSNRAVVESNTWDFIIDFYDGLSGLDMPKIISNAFFIYAGGDNLFDTGDEVTNSGKWTNLSSVRLAFIPVKPASCGFYRIFVRPCDGAGNNGSVRQIDFTQSDQMILSGVYHEFEPYTQLTPGVPLEVTLKGSPGLAAWFEVTGCSNIKNIPMTEISGGIYQGKYIITKNDLVKDGIVRGYLKGPFFEKNRDADVKIDIGERIEARRGKPVLIVSKDDVHTGLMIPDNAFQEDMKAEIRKTDLLMDRFMFDFSMSTYEGQKPVEYFDTPVTLRIHYSVKEGTVERLAVPEESLPGKASLFFFDRVKWMKTGGNFNLEKDYISGSVRHFSLFALALDTGKEGLTVAPNPFTPNGDSDFDRVHFICDLLQGERQEAHVKIFSLDGSLKRELALPDGTLNNLTVDILWDGRDGKGRALSQGIYIYQAVMGERKFRGTVVLAR